MIYMTIQRNMNQKVMTLHHIHQIHVVYPYTYVKVYTQIIIYR